MEPWSDTGTSVESASVVDEGSPVGEKKAAAFAPPTQTRRAQLMARASIGLAKSIRLAASEERRTRVVADVKRGGGLALEFGDGIRKRGVEDGGEEVLVVADDVAGVAGAAADEPGAAGAGAAGCCVGVGAVEGGHCFPVGEGSNCVRGGWEWRKVCRAGRAPRPSLSGPQCISRTEGEMGLVQPGAYKATTWTAYRARFGLVRSNANPAMLS